MTTLPRKQRFQIYSLGLDDLGIAKDTSYNGVTQMVVITRYIGVVHTERDQYH